MQVLIRLMECVVFLHDPVSMVILLSIIIRLLVVRPELGIVLEDMVVVSHHVLTITLFAQPTQFHDLLQQMAQALL